VGLAAGAVIQKQVPVSLCFFWASSTWLLVPVKVRVILAQNAHALTSVVDSHLGRPRLRDEAYEVGVDALEDAAYSRAVEGVATPIFDKEGKQIGKKVEHSDRLLELLLKSKRPRVYGRQENSFNQTVNVSMPTLADMRKKYLELGLTPPEIEGDFAEVKDDAGA